MIIAAQELTKLTTRVISFVLKPINLFYDKTNLVDGHFVKIIFEEYVGEAWHLNPVQGHVLATHVILQFKCNYIFREKEFPFSSMEYHR